MGLTQVFEARIRPSLATRLGSVRWSFSRLEIYDPLDPDHASRGSSLARLIGLSQEPRPLTGGVCLNLFANGQLRIEPVVGNNCRIFKPGDWRGKIWWPLFLAARDTASLGEVCLALLVKARLFAYLQVQRSAAAPGQPLPSTTLTQARQG